MLSRIEVSDRGAGTLGTTASGEVATTIGPAGGAPAPNAGRLGSESRERLAGSKVLVVDDDCDARDLLGYLLESCKISVERAESVREALSTLESFRPDVIISDIAMPGEDGYAFIRALRRHPLAIVRELPVIALTAFAQTEDRHKALLAGFSCHLAKPVELAELLDILAHCAGRADCMSTNATNVALAAR